MKIVALFLLFFCVSCSHNLPDIKCRHNVISTSFAVYEKFPTRIAVGQIDDINHVQTQIKVKEEWVFVEKYRQNNLKIIELHNFTIIGYLNLKDYVNILFAEFDK